MVGRQHAGGETVRTTSQPAAQSLGHHQATASPAAAYFCITFAPAAFQSAAHLPSPYPPLPQRSHDSRALPERSRPPPASPGRSWIPLLHRRYPAKQGQAKVGTLTSRQRRDNRNIPTNPRNTNFSPVARSPVRPVAATLTRELVLVHAHHGPPQSPAVVYGV